MEKRKNKISLAAQVREIFNEYTTARKKLTAQKYSLIKKQVSLIIEEMNLPNTDRTKKLVREELIYWIYD